MKNLISQLLKKNGSHWNLAFIFTILLALVSGCSDGGDSSGSAAKTPEKKVPPAYIGTWTGQDGSTVTFRNDGSGDYKSGGTSVTGASVEIDEAAKEIRFTFMGFDSGRYKIDEPPKKNRMRLDGMEYRRTSGFSTEDDEEEESGASRSGEVPTDAELSALADETIRNLDRAIQQNDFDDFYATISEIWRRKVTAAYFQTAFADTVLQKDRYKLKKDAPLTFKSRPTLREDNRTFDLFGSYPTTISGRSVPFQLRYVKENDEWKLLGIYLNPDNPPENEK